MMYEIWWSLPLTLIVFFLARKLAARFKFPLLNPLLVAMVVIIPFCYSAVSPTIAIFRAVKFQRFTSACGCGAGLPVV